MIKSTDEKEMESVIRDILNPFREIDIKYEAWQLTHEEGWHKQIEAEWIKQTYMAFSDYTIKCSHCNESFDRKSYQQPYNYCPNCGAKMIGIKE